MANFYALCSEQNPRFKARNEDAAAAAVIRNREGVPMLVGVVADGVSGLPHGDAAARLAVRGFLDELERSDFSSAAALAADAKALLNRVNRSVLDLGDGGAGCTFTAAVVIDRRLVVIHLGDSSCAWLGRDGGGAPASRRLTDAHTLVAAAKASGATDEEVDSLHQHAIDRCMGDPEVDPQVLLAPPGLDPPWGRLLLATDGVTDVWTQGELLAVVGREPDAAQACQTVCREALARRTARGKPNRDNITCVVLEVSAFDTGAEETRDYAGAAADVSPPLGKARIPLRKRALVLAMGTLGLALLISGGITLMKDRSAIEADPLTENAALENDRLPSSGEAFSEESNLVVAAPLPSSDNAIAPMGRYGESGFIVDGATPDLASSGQNRPQKEEEVADTPEEGESKLPGGAPSVATETYTIYFVIEGDSAAKIAHEHELKLEELEKLNPGITDRSAASKLLPGDEIKVPMKPQR